MASPHAQADRRHSVGDPLEPARPVREAAGRRAAGDSKLNRAQARAHSGNNSPRSFAAAGPVARRAPRAGLVAIVALIGALGFLVQHKLQGDDSPLTSSAQTARASGEATASSSATSPVGAAAAAAPEWARGSGEGANPPPRREPMKLITGIQLVEHTEEDPFANRARTVRIISDDDAAPSAVDPFSRGASRRADVEAPRGLFEPDPFSAAAGSNVSTAGAAPAARAPAQNMELEDGFARPIPLDGTPADAAPDSAPPRQFEARPRQREHPLGEVIEQAEPIQRLSGIEAPGIPRAPLQMDLGAPPAASDGLPPAVGIPELTNPVEIGHGEFSPRQSQPSLTPVPPPRFQPEQSTRPIPPGPPSSADYSPQRRFDDDFSTGRSTQQTSAAHREQPPAAAPEEVYQVQSGDNYWTISRRFYSTARYFAALAEYNKSRIPRPERMKPGMYVLVPDADVLCRRYPQLVGIDAAAAESRSADQSGFFVDEGGQPCYRVSDGDTLGDIAQRHLGRSSRSVQIYGMNRDRIPNPDALKIGTVLRLPADACQVALSPLHAAGR